MLFFSVQDTGIGIRPEDQERIFLSFEQAAGKKSDAPGTGLGLAISRSLVELMGGKLSLNSRPNVGSEFSFTVGLPVYSGVLEPKKEAESWESSSLAGMHVLLAEDNDINAEIAIELLRIRQIKVDRAADGRQAVEMFASHTEGYYDAILMDVNMPVMDGIEATVQIQALDRPDAAAIPIMAMTANTFQEDREMTKQAGMTGFLPKPFDARQLYEALERFVARI